MSKTVFTRYGNVRSISYFRQDNNPTEQVNLKNGIQQASQIQKILTNKVSPEILNQILKVVNNYLETCGPTAALACIASIHGDQNIKTPGGFILQPEEVLSDYLNDPRNHEKLRKYATWANPATTHGNRVAAYYPLAVKEVFGYDVEFVNRKLSLAEVSSNIEKGKAVQLLLENPGHYIAAVGFDFSTNEIIFNDSWPNRFPDRDGFNKRMKPEEYATNIKAAALIYG